MGSLPVGDSSSSDIAVVGLACRFPGGATNPTKFWDLLHERRCTNIAFLSQAIN